MKTFEKNIYSNGKLYLSKDLKSILKVDVGDLLGVYKESDSVIIEKFEGICLHCHSEKLDPTDKGAVCYKCHLKPEDRVTIVENVYAVSKIPSVNIVNIPESIRESMGIFVDKDNKKGKKIPVIVSGMPNKRKLIIKKNKDIT